MNTKLSIIMNPFQCYLLPDSRFFTIQILLINNTPYSFNVDKCKILVEVYLVKLSQLTNDKIEILKVKYLAKSMFLHVSKVSKICFLMHAAT